MIVNKQPLYMQIVKELEGRIENGLYENGTRLASEPDLAQEFGVSRGTLREALGILEKEGYLVREHGRGSFIRTKHKVLAGIEKLEALTTAIRHAGYRPGDEVLDIRREKLSKTECKILGLEKDAYGFVIESLRTADDVPVIYCYDVLPLEVISSMKEAQKRRNYDCMTEFLEEVAKEQPVQYDSTLTAVLAQKPIADFLKVPVNAPLIRLRGSILGYRGQAINYSVQFFNADAYQFRLVRK